MLKSGQYVIKYKFSKWKYVSIADVGREDTQIVGAIKEYADVRERWRRMIHFGNSQEYLSKAEEVEYINIVDGVVVKKYQVAAG